MNEDRWVVLGLAHPRVGWFSELARWSTAATVPVDFVKCVSPDEVRARLSSGRAYSALLVGSDVIGLDRDLIDATRTAGAAAIAVGPERGRDWADLGVSRILPVAFDPADLMAALAEHAQPIGRVDTASPKQQPVEALASPRGRLIAVAGPGGSGTSVHAMALAQTFGSDGDSSVLLADLARSGEQAMLHDAREVVPGIHELVDAHRRGRLSVDETRAMTFDAIGRGYHLLLGLRRPRDWTAIKARSFESALDSLRRSYRTVVADIDADIEGEAETGSFDVEDRNLIARNTIARADVVVITGVVGLKGLHSNLRVVRDFRRFGVASERIVPVLTRAPRALRHRAEISRALDALAGSDDDLADLPAPVFVPERRDLERALRDGVRLPRAMGMPVRHRVDRVLALVGHRASDEPRPVAVVPGTVGSWTDEEVG